MSIKDTIQEYKLGTITGFIFGILSLPLAALGLVSTMAFVMIPFALPGAVAVGIGTIFGLGILPGILVNAFFYAYIGFLIQRRLRKKGKNEKIVLYIPIAIIGLVVLLILLESVIRGGLTP